MNKIDIAKVCHEVNKEFCSAIGDDSQLKWDDAPEWQKESALTGVDLHITDPNLGPEHSHISWVKEKISNGWVYGDVKDPSKKQHPCLVEFHNLPKEQQAKDYIFRAIVHSLSTHLETK